MLGFGLGFKIRVWVIDRVWVRVGVRVVNMFGMVNLWLELTLLKTLTLTLDPNPQNEIVEGDP